uniref:LRRNT domain-containing protein n=1 Tax=Haplochromis burtoni TaxID=8153 RepID=A0A3Q2VQ47_HAPBU
MLICFLYVYNVILTLLFLLCLGFPPSMAACPPSCLCASDIISCSGCNLSVVPFDLPGYATRLDLSHNRLTALHVGWISQPLQRLVTLILGKNFIRSIDVNTFNDLYNLQRLYLSTNRLSVFPLVIYEEPEGPLNLTFLDLSYNRLTKVPVQSLLSLTRQRGIYLQENPLVCDCALLALLEYWMWKQYPPLLDFRGDYPCKKGAESGWLRVPCPGLTLPAQEGLVVFWVTPTTVLNSSNSDLSAPAFNCSCSIVLRSGD